MGGMTGLLLLLWVGVTVSSVVDLRKRIYGGEDCAKEERPYHVKLTNFTGHLICGGSLISDKWVLTAAHCWEWRMKAVVAVRPGSNKKHMLIETPPVICGDNNKIHDIMLLQLPETTTITPVQLPDCNKSLKEGDPIRIAGSGPFKHNNVIIEYAHLQCANTSVVNCKALTNCLRRDKENARFLSWQHWRCFNTDKADTTGGDSGGGVVHEFNKMDYLYGVISFGAKKVCTKPGAFMDVCKYRDWIKKITGM